MISNGGNLFRSFYNTGAAEFPVGDWIKAPTSQPTPVSVGTLSTTSPTLNCRIEPIDADRFVLFYLDASGYPTVRIATRAGTPSAGSAVTVVSTSTTNLMLLRRVPNTNYWILGVNNDLYFINAGASGTTVTSTQISADAGDAGRAEAFTQGITDIVIADDGTHFVIMNEFNNGGTRSFVSALWTLTVGTPAAVYVTRDVDATGSANAANCASGYLRGGNGYFVMDTGLDLTTLYMNKVTFTSSTVSNAVTAITVSGIANSTIPRSFSRNLSRFQTEIADIIVHCASAAAGLNFTIDISSTPALYGTTPAYAPEYNALAPFNVHGQNEVALGTGQSNAGTAIRHRNYSYGAASRNLITGLTTYNIHAACYSNDLNWLIVLGRVNTNDGYIYFLKNAAA